MTDNDMILLAHGAGGRKSADLIRDLFLRHFSNPTLDLLGDAAVLTADAALGKPAARLAFTTDSFVVSPLFFPGGDIGKLAVCGTVNDLACAGATPHALSAAFILEEGLEVAVLDRILTSMSAAAAEAGVSIVTGDTKVVARGSADKIFITTSGVGFILDGLTPGGPSGPPLPSPDRAAPGDAVLLSGPIAEHGMAVMTAREGLRLGTEIRSDCAPLASLVAALLAAAPDTHALRDPTRGGVAAVLNEIAAQSGVCVEIDEEAVPVSEGVRVACELLGIDPLHVANEGKLVAMVPADQADAALAAMRAHRYGAGAAIIGRVLEGPAGRVHLKTVLGSLRLLDLPAGDLLPRIC